MNEKVIKETLSALREEVVLPFIKASEYAKKEGVTVDAEGNLREDKYGLNVLPFDEEDSTLMAHFDSNFCALISTPNVVKRCESIAKRAFASRVSLHMAIVNWRLSCSSALMELARGPENALEFYRQDPIVMISSTMALHMYMTDCHMREDVDKLLAMLYAETLDKAQASK